MCAEFGIVGKSSTIIYPVGRDFKNGGFSNKDLSSSRKSDIYVLEILISDNSAYHLLYFQCRYESLENSLSSHACVQLRKSIQLFALLLILISIPLTTTHCTANDMAK